MAHKEDGNHHFKAKKYQEAIIAYSEGLKQKFDDAELRVVLLTNRAIANFNLGKNCCIKRVRKDFCKSVGSTLNCPITSFSMYL